MLMDAATNGKGPFVAEPFIVAVSSYGGGGRGMERISSGAGTLHTCPFVQITVKK